MIHHSSIIKRLYFLCAIDSFIYTWQIITKPNTSSNYFSKVNKTNVGGKSVEMEATTPINFILKYFKNP